MTEDIDSRLGRLLRVDSVAERDALFRIQLLERSEQQRYQRQVRTRLIFVATLGLLPLLLLVDLPAMPLVNEGLIATFGIALLAAAFFCLRGVLQAVRWMRGAKDGAPRAG